MRNCSNIIWKSASAGKASVLFILIFSVILTSLFAFSGLSAENFTLHDVNSTIDLDEEISLENSSNNSVVAADILQTYINDGTIVNESENESYNPILNDVFNQTLEINETGILGAQTSNEELLEQAPKAEAAKIPVLDYKKLFKIPENKIVSKKKIEESDILSTSNGLLYNNSVDIVGIEMIANGVPVSFSYNFTLSNGILYPEIRFAIPSDAVANLLKNKTINITYNIQFNTNVSETYQKPLIALYSENFVYKPRFECRFNKFSYEKTIIGRILSRELLNDQAVQFNVSYDIIDLDSDGDGNLFFAEINITQGMDVACSDPIFPNQEVNQRNGTIFWANSTNAFLRHFGTNGFQGPTNQAINDTGGILRTCESDYSRVGSVGLVCCSDSNKNIMLWAINTSNSSAISFTNLSQAKYSNILQSCNVKFLNGSNVALVVYENGTTGDPTETDDSFLARVYNGNALTLGNPTKISFDTPLKRVAGNGANYTNSFAIKQRPGTSNQMAVTFLVTGLDELCAACNDDSAGIIFLNITLTGGLLNVFNYTTDNTTNPDQGNNGNEANYQDGAWTSDGLFFVDLISNQTTSINNGNITVAIVNLTNTSNITVVPPFAVASSVTTGSGQGDAPQIRTCTIPNQTDRVVYIGNHHTAGIFSPFSAVFSINRSAEKPIILGAEQRGGERDAGEYNINIFCYPSESGTKVTLGYIESEGTQNAKRVDIFGYYGANKSYDVSDMDNALTSANVALDDIENLKCTPFPEGDGCMFTTVDLVSDLTSGMYMNGSVVDTRYATTIESTMPQTGGSAYAFLFEGTLQSSGLVIQSSNNAPTHSTPFITGNGTNTTTANITSYPQGGSDSDGDNFINLTTFTVNNTNKRELFYLSGEQNFTDFYDRNPLNASGTIEIIGNGAYGKSINSTKGSDFDLVYNWTQGPLINFSIGSFAILLNSSGYLNDSNNFGSSFFQIAHNKSMYFHLLNYREDGFKDYSGFQFCVVNISDDLLCLNSQHNVTPNSLYYLVYTWNSTEIAIWINGTKWANITTGFMNGVNITPSLTSSTDYMSVCGQRIFPQDDTTVKEWDGWCDEIHIYNYVLPADQIQYNNERRGFNDKLAPSISDVGDSIFSTVKPVDSRGLAGLAKNSSMLIVQADAVSSRIERVIKSWSFCADDQGFTGYAQRNVSLCSLEEVASFSSDVVSANASGLNFSLSNSSGYNVTFKIQSNNGTINKLYGKTQNDSRTGNLRYNVERQSANLSAIKFDAGTFSKTCNFDSFANVTVSIRVDRVGLKTMACVDLCDGCSDWEDFSDAGGDYVALDTGTLGNLSGNIQPFRIFNVTIIDLNNSIHFLLTDTTNPRINGSINAPWIRLNQKINFTANVSDETGLTFCQFIINQTGAKQFFNKSLSGASDQCSQNFTISAAAGSIINFTAIVNDTSNNLNQTSQIIAVTPSNFTVFLALNETSGNSAKDFASDGINHNLSWIASDTLVGFTTKGGFTGLGFNGTGTCCDMPTIVNMTGLDIQLGMSATFTATLYIEDIGKYSQYLGRLSSGANMFEAYIDAGSNITIAFMGAAAQTGIGFKNKSIQDVCIVYDNPRDILLIVVNGTLKNNLSMGQDQDDFVLNSFNIGHGDYNAGILNGSLRNVRWLVDYAASVEECQNFYNQDFATVDSTPPIINGTLNKSSAILQGNVINASFNATDENALSLGQVIINDTGFNRIFNFSLSGASAQFSQNFTVSCPSGCVVNVTGRVNDTSNNFKQNSSMFTVADVTLPEINGSVNKSSNIIQGNILNATFNSTDETQLSFCQIVINDTGFKRFFNFSLSGTAAQCSQNFTVSCSSGCVINISGIVNDTSNNLKTNQTLLSVSDAIKPRVNASLNISIAIIGQSVNYTANVSDDLQLSFCQIIINQSSNGAKEYFNKSVAGTNDQCSQNFTIALAARNVINFSVMVNDSSGNLNFSQQLLTVADQVRPVINGSLNKSANIIPNDVLNISFNLTDDIELSACQIVINDTGYKRYFNFSASGVSAQCSQNFTVSCQAGCVVNATGIANDSYNNVRINTTIFTVADLVNPAVNGTINKSLQSIIQYDVLNASFNATDETLLSFGQVILNDTGFSRVFNFSLGGTAATFSQNFSVSCSSGCVINITGRVNDSSNNFRQNSTIVVVSDIVKPRLNVSINDSNVNLNEVVNLTANVSDDLQLSSCQFIENQSLSGGAKTYVNKTAIGSNDQCSQNFTIRLGVGHVINFTVIVNDTSNNINQTSLIVAVIDTIAPAIGGFLNKSLQTIFQNDIINASYNASDENGLSFGQIIINDTGFKRYFNFSLSGTSAGFSQNVSISCGTGCIVNITGITNDTSNNLRANNTIITVQDSSLPTINGNLNKSQSNILPNDVINASFDVTDDAGLSACQIAINDTGVKRFFNMTLSGLTGKCSQNFTVSCLAGCQINITGSVNDTNANYKQTEFILTVADAVSPRINTSLNSSTFFRFNSVNISSNVSDETGLSTCQFIINQSGAKEYFNKSVSGTNDKCSQNFTISVGSGNVINVSVVVNDTSNNKNQTQYLISISDDVSPRVNASLNASVLVVNQIINFTANASDDLQLSICQFIDNQSLSNGAKNYINKSLSGASDQCSQNYTIRLEAHNIINFTVIVNDSAGNSNQSSQIIEVADLTAPAANATINNSAPKYNQVVNHTANVSDDIGLSYCQIITNQTGAKQFFNTSLSGTAAQCSQNFTVLLSRGGVINFSIIVNDSSNNFKTNDTIITIANSPPQVAAFQPSNSSPQFNFTLNLSFNVTGSDPDGNSITFDWYVNGTHNLSNQNLSMIFNNTGVYNVSSVLSDEVDNLTQQWLVTIINDTQVGSSGGSGSSGGGTSGGGGGGGGGGSSSGGGGGGGTPDSSSAGFFMQSISSGHRQVLRISLTKEIPIYKIEFTATKNLNDISVDLKAHNASTTPLALASLPVFAYVEISHKNLLDSDIRNVVAEYKVSKSWINSNNLTEDTIKLWRFSSAWTEMPSRKINESDSWVYFAADLPGLSLFAITTEKYEIEIGNSTGAHDDSVTEEKHAEIIKEPQIQSPSEVQEPQEECGNNLCRGMEYFSCPRDCYKFNFRLPKWNVPKLNWAITAFLTVILLLCTMIGHQTWIYAKRHKPHRHSEEKIKPLTEENIRKETEEIKKLQGLIQSEKKKQKELGIKNIPLKQQTRSAKKEYLRLQDHSKELHSKAVAVPEKIGLFSKLFSGIPSDESAAENKGKLLAKFGFEKGELFLLRDKDDSKAISIFRTLASLFSGVAIVRNNPQKLGIIKNNVESWWLTESEGNDSIKPGDVEEVYYVVEKFLKKNKECIVLIGGLDLIKRATNFKSLSRLLKEIKDEISSKEVVVLVPFNQDALSREESEQLKSEFKTI